MGRIEVTIKETPNYYFFLTIERIKKCLECKREYKSRKYCLNCSKKKGKKVPTVTYPKQREGMITKDLTKFNCTCIFGSWFRWGKHWLDNHPKSTCRHVKWAFRKIKQMED